MAIYRTCPTCNGTGLDGCDWYCYACNGSGQEEVEPDEPSPEDDDCDDEGEG